MRADTQLLVPKTSLKTTGNEQNPKKQGIGMKSPALFSSWDDRGFSLDDTSCSTTTSSADNDDTTSTSTTIFHVHPDEPNLYQIPSDLKPEFGPLPVLLRLCVWLVAALTSAVTTCDWKDRGLTWTWASPLVALAKNEGVNVRTTTTVLASFLVKAWILATLSKAVLQEVRAPPSRISIRDLAEKYVLPSTLSRFESVPVRLSSSSAEEEESTSLGVHYLHYQAEPKKQPARFHAVYVNHGFGASSLSWLPVLPKMVDRLKARVGLGHDAVGFGFTDRPQNLEAFTTTGSASIGMALLEKQREQQPKPSHTGHGKPVLLMGHSMGALATLQMALTLPEDTKKFVVLIAPAVGMRPFCNRKRKESKSAFRINALLVRTAHKVGSGASMIGQYCLRRLVGCKHFWRTGLVHLAWGPKKVLDGDVIRYQWPSIGLGWEEGLVSLTRANSRPMHFTDRELIEQALDANVTIKVILGCKDRVVTPQHMRNFFTPYRDRIQIVEMEDTAHNPHEEDLDAFLGVLEQMLEADEDLLLSK